MLACAGGAAPAASAGGAPPCPARPTSAGAAPAGGGVRRCAVVAQTHGVVWGVGVRRCAVVTQTHGVVRVRVRVCVCVVVVVLSCCASVVSYCCLGSQLAVDGLCVVVREQAVGTACRDERRQRRFYATGRGW